MRFACAGRACKVRERRRRLWGIDFEASLHISASLSACISSTFCSRPHTYVRLLAGKVRAAKENFFTVVEIKWRAPPPFARAHPTFEWVCVCVCLHLCSALISRHSTQKEGRSAAWGWKIQQLWVVFPALCVRCIAPRTPGKLKWVNFSSQGENYLAIRENSYFCARSDKEEGMSLLWRA